MIKDNPHETDDEVEVTTEMLEAGSHELAKFDLDYESYEERAEAIFRAMYAKMPPNVK